MCSLFIMTAKHARSLSQIALAVTSVLSGCGSGGGGDSADNSAEASALACVSASAVEPAQAPPQPESTQSKWASYERLFAVDSPWNSRPIDPVLGDAQVPLSTYYPAVQEGAYSTGVFLASTTDPPVTVKGLPGKPGVWDPDAEQYQDSITIPHWPASTLPATGSDGHADIVDPQSGIVHSFFKLQLIDGEWRALQYAWSRLDGRGWGDPAHHRQGARAAGVPSSAGLIRTHEIDDGDTMYRHALAMSLTYNALSASPTYVYPATSADTNAATTNTGSIPMGSLMMLPASFDTDGIRSLKLRKVAETLKHYGAYVVDRNVGTPFVIYVEIGSAYTLHAGGKWDNVVARDLHRIREQLRPVASVGGWVDGDEQPFVPSQRFNILSMQGPWQLTGGAQAGRYDTLKQALVFEANCQVTTMTRTSSQAVTRATWALPTPGLAYKLTARGSGGARLRMVLSDCDKPNEVIDSQALSDGQSYTFIWPRQLCSTQLVATSGGNQASSLTADLFPVTTN